MVQVKVLFWSLQSNRTSQNQLYNQLYAVNSFSFWQRLGESRWINARPGYEDVCCGWYQLEEALPGLVWDPGLFWRAGVSREQQTGSPVASLPHSVRAFIELFLSQPGVAGWTISGLPEQLIHPTVYSLLTPFLGIPKTQAAWRQAGDELWEAAASLECLCLWLGEVREGLCLPEPHSPHPTARLAAPHPDWEWETMERVSPRGPFWQQSSLVPGLHRALPS